MNTWQIRHTLSERHIPKKGKGKPSDSLIEGVWETDVTYPGWLGKVFLKGNLSCDLIDEKEPPM